MRAPRSSSEGTERASRPANLLPNTLELRPKKRPGVGNASGTGKNSFRLGIILPPVVF